MVKVDLGGWHLFNTKQFNDLFPFLFFILFIAYERKKKKALWAMLIIETDFTLKALCRFSNLYKHEMRVKLNL